MRFEVLGPMRVTDGRVTRPVTGVRQRILLGALLERANQSIPADQLVEIVWDGAPPGRAVHTLRTYMTRLRHDIGPAGAAHIVTRDQGYLAEVGPDELDSLAFEALCRNTDRAIRGADWAGASDCADAALALWRGVPLADVPSQALRDTWLPHLNQQRVQVTEWRIEAELHLGRHKHLVSQLHQLIAHHPVHERFRAQLILALHRCGRQAEALAAYQDARKVLVEELGIEPGPELRHLHKRILAGEGDPPAQRPSVAPVPNGASPGTAPRQLPGAARHFTGRQHELNLITNLLGSSHTAEIPGSTAVISAIDGMAGVGKTALAVHAAHRLADRFPDGQLFLDLHGYTQGQRPRSAGQALAWLLRSLGVPAGQIPKEREHAAALYRQRLAGTKTLIVLDNALDEAQVRPLLPGQSGCLVLVTSRRRLKGLDDACSLSLDLLPPDDAAKLLRAVAGDDRIPANDPVLAEIVRLCGRLPLALRIAGALLRHRPAWSPGHLAGLLRDQRRRVARLSDGERDLGVVFDLSCIDLDDAHGLLFRRLGLIPGPDADAYAAAALLGCDPHAATGLLEDLVDHNLLIGHAPGRYRLHDLIRAHAAALADTDPRPDRDTAFDRLLHYYAHTAQTASISIARHPRPAPENPVPAHVPALRGPETAWAWLRAERDNLEAAFTRARACALDRHVVALAAGLAEILHTDGPYTRALDLHEAATATAQRHGWPTAQAIALADLAWVRRLVGDLAGAGDAMAQALEIFRATGDRRGEAVALSALGTVRLLTGDLPGAGGALTRALEIFRAIGNRCGEASALNNLGNARLLAGDLPAAGDAMAQALEICRAAGHRTGEAYALGSLARVRRLAGDLPAAVHAASRALEIYRMAGSRGDLAWALNHYAAAIAATGDLPRALALYQQALTTDRELIKPDDEAASLEGIGECLLAAGASQGTTHLRHSLETFERLGMRPDAERVASRLANLAPA